jgi:sugar lactone lactonase YvrE
MSLFRNSEPTPRLEILSPPAALPGGTVELVGEHLDPAASRIPHATIGDTFAPVTLSRPGRAMVQIPEATISGDIVLHRNGSQSNPLPLRVAVPMADNLHPVGNPAVDANGELFATLSGSRGQAVPVSIFRIQRDFQMTPFVRDLMNPTGLAFDRVGYLYASSRAEGTVYRISPTGEISTYAEGMGVATGLAFDTEGNLYVGDRSGTIFKINPEREIFVFATLEPSIAAYHLAFNSKGTLFVTGPTTSSNQAVHAIDRDGSVSVFYRGLGRAQGIAFDVDDNLYVAASLHGRRGIVRITPDCEASLAVSGNDLVGLAFLEDGCAALATHDALYHVDLGIEGRPLI